MVFSYCLVTILIRDVDLHWVVVSQLNVNRNIVLSRSLSDLFIYLNLIRIQVITFLMALSFM
jgi:hypothetical protein